MTTFDYDIKALTSKNYYPEMPPMLDGETAEQYTDRLTGADQTNRRPYNHRRFRQCSIGYHGECSANRTGDPDCECPCHDDSFGLRLLELLSRVEFRRENQWLVVSQDKAIPGGRYFLQVHSNRPDAATGIESVGKGGKAYLSEHMTDSEIVRKAFQLFLGYNEHEVRELFLYDGLAIFGPHIDVEALWQAAEQLDVRDAPEPSGDPAN